MDWEQYVFYIGITEALDREALKRQKELEQKTKALQAKGRR